MIKNYHDSVKYCANFLVLSNFISAKESFDREREIEQK